MKKVMKLLSITVLAISILSCEKNEEDTTPEGIVTGEWQLVDLRRNSEELNVTECFKKSTLTVKRDSVFYRTTYTNEEDCIIDDTESGNGTWAFAGSIYGELLTREGNSPKEVELSVSSARRNELLYLERLTEETSDGPVGFTLRHVYERIE